MKALFLRVFKYYLWFKQFKIDMTLLGLITVPPFLMTERLLHHQPSHIKELYVLQLKCCVISHRPIMRNLPYGDFLKIELVKSRNFSANKEKEEKDTEMYCFLLYSILLKHFNLSNTSVVTTIITSCISNQG